MDYDDDDISHHNLQLAGESRSRSSSVLKRYDFPKFDFDDNLQGHLRFDSLVETEVYLGIQSQEDSQWIEDYSRGSNGMEFNSNPADSCSISGRDNIWFEATSSESVEMLLKSVGQEEIMPASSALLGTNACVNQDTSGDHVESGAALGARNLDTTLAKDEVLNDRPTSDSHMGDQLPHVVCPSPNPENIGSSCEISQDLTERALNASDDLTTEGKNTHHSEHACENSKVLKTFDEKSISCGYGGDSSHYNSKNDSNYVAKLGSSEASQVINSDQSAVVDSVEAPSASSMLEAELNLSEADLKMESLTTAVQTGEGKELSASHEVKDYLKGCPGGSPVDGSTQHSTKQCSSSEQKMNFPVHLLPRELMRIEDVQTNEDVQTTHCLNNASFEKPPLPLKDIKFCMGKGECIKNTGDRELVSFNDENNQSEKVEGCQTESVAVEEVPSAQSPGRAEGDSGQVINEKLGQRKAGFPASGQGIFDTNDQGGKHDVNTGNMESISEDIVMPSTRLETYSEGVDEEVKVDINHQKLQIQTSGEREAESDVKSATVSCPDFGEMGSVVTGLSNPGYIYDEDCNTRLPNARPITGVSSVSEPEACMAVNFSQDHLSSDFVKSQQFVEKFNEMSSKRSPSSEATTTTTTATVHLDDPTVIIGFDNCSPKSSDTEVMTKNDGDQESPHLAEVVKVSCGSPTIISSSEPSQLEKDNVEVPRVSEVAATFAESSQLTSEDVKGNDVVGDDSSFTFKVNALPETSREPGKSWSPICDTEKCNSPVVGKECLPSRQGKAEKMPPPKSPRLNARTTDVEPVRGIPKGASERKGRRGSGKAVVKESGKKGPQAQGTNEKTSSRKQDKDTNAVAVSKSTFPSSPGLRQPFTDLQQVQLRAQIFVYGSLIQGAAPDEACMVSAFGLSDVGRNSWEPIWQVTVERVRSQKCGPNATETPLHSMSGIRASDLALKQSSCSKGLTASVSKVSSKDVPATISSPIMPLSSPLWSISTPSNDHFCSSALHKGAVVDFQQPVTPLHSFQTPPIGSFIGHTSWPSQTCFPSPWLASAQTPTFNSTLHFQPVTMTETVKLMPVKDTFLPPTSAIKYVASSSAVHTGGPSAYGVASSPHDLKTTSSSDLHSVDPKLLKRKKGPSAEHHHSISVSVAQTVPLFNQSQASLQTSAAGHPAGSPEQVVLIGKLPADGLSLCSDVPPLNSNFDTAKTGASSDKSLKYVAEAMTVAEEAAGHATAAVSHSEELWRKLTEQKESGLTSEVEAKLVSAAAAISAAGSVAKAAAAAAKVACNAALQAKLMADEALLPSKLCSEAPSGNSFTDVLDEGNATPASILKGDVASNQSSSILVAAKEAAKRRVEAASAASKQAENLDAIVKAAELAAAAVSQAGRIVAMGEPLLLKDLFDSGPEGYWKLPQSPSERQGSRKTGHVKLHTSENLKDSVGGHLRLADGATVERESILRRNGIKPAGVGFQPDHIQGTSYEQNEHDELADAPPDDDIKKGSFVEVFKRGGKLKSAWYSANVLRLQDGKAFVSYCDLSSDEGSGTFCEWVSLGSEGEKAPTIRIGHPTTSVLHQKTRKRRRAALGDYSWCVGDNVDVWIDDCWWEGVVIETNAKDETPLKVHFPVQGESLSVRSWNLRPSRSWINGKWVEWSSVRAHNSLHQSDTPQEKRLKLGSPVIATKRKDQSSKDLNAAAAQTGESKLSSLSTNERTFHIGKTVKEDNKYTVHRPLRSGKLKEGSRVVIGVPKPTGKKRKFMDVSKHYPTNKGEKSTDATDLVKSSKYLLSQGAGSRGWKLPSKNDSGDKRIVETRPRIPGTRKSQRTVPRRDNVGSTSGHDSDNGIGQGSDFEDHVGGGGLSDKVGQCFVDEAAEAPLSSLLPPSQNAFSKRTISSNSKPERLTRGKLGPLGAKLSKVEEDKVYMASSDKAGLDIAEPRRSNRRFQPTHRLLEGMQSSMIIPKMPSVSHEKVPRNHSRRLFTRGK